MPERQTVVLLPSGPDAPQLARRRLAELCRECPPDVVAIAALLVSEVVTNALRHSDGTLRLRAALTPDHLHVEVEDSDPNPPQLMQPSVADESGRGMQIIDALASQWGTAPPQPSAAGKAVWFRVRRDARI